MSQSNLYAEKVFAEHPIALWSLDDQLDFVSLLPTSYSVEDSWSLSQSVEAFNIYLAEDEFVPMESSYKFDITGSAPVSPQTTNSLKISLPIANFSTLDSDKGTICLGSYFYSITNYLSYVKIGYSYVDPDTSSVVEVLETFSDVQTNIWAYLSKSFSIPNVSAQFSIVFEIGYSSPPSEVETDYDFYLNGISLGQWSEDFNVSSTGIKTSAAPQEIATDIDYVVPATAYGLQNTPGYYAASTNKVYAKNTGIPMVYGASNVTRMYPNGNSPSAIFPGFGFLNKAGQYQEYTVEMWLRLGTQSSSPKKIFGPLHSEDGLYSYGSFLMLKIGKSYASHYIGEWNRPMLIDIRVFEDGANMLINGEQVLDLAFSTSDLNFPDKLDDTGKEQDWLGFYVHQGFIEVDCFSIFSYKVPEIIAKRRFVYGQGVEFPKNINTSYNGKSFFVDYAFSEYSNNYNYPDISRWSDASIENLTVFNEILSTPKYELPSLYFSNPELQSIWLDKNLDLNRSVPKNQGYVSLSPSSEFEESDSYMLLPTLDLIDKTINAIYGIFSISENPDEEQILMFVEDSQSSNYFSISINESTIYYKFMFNSSESVVFSARSQSLQNEFFAGIKIDSLINAFGQSMSVFFGNPSRLKVYVGGNRALDKTFRGNIYRVGVSSGQNSSQISDLFDANGFAITPSDVFDLYFDESPDDGQIDVSYDGSNYDLVLDDWPFGESLDLGTYDSVGSGKTFLTHNATYTIVANVVIDQIVLDIATGSSWEDAIPLSSLAKYVSDASGNRVYELDFIQFNLNYPRCKTVDSGKLSTDSENVRAYITFKELSLGSHSDTSGLLYTEKANSNGVLQPSADWRITEYEVVDGTIIYPPANADFENLSIGIRLDIQSSGQSINPIKIKSLQLASQAFNFAGPNKINTKFSAPMYPYTRNGVYFDYKSTNPYEIYKFSSPYLYLTDNSGIKLKGDISNNSNRGITMPINTELVSLLSLGAVQMSLKYLENEFPIVPVKIAEIDGKTDKIYIYLVAANAEKTRGRVFAKNASDVVLVDDIEISDQGVSNIEGTAFYLNGQLVKECFINLDEWSNLSLQFAGGISLNAYVGAIRITGPILVNNVVAYPLSANQVIFTTIQRLWRDLPLINITYWLDLISSTPPFLWSDILYVPSQRTYNLDPAELYRSLIGTNKISITDDSQLLFKNHKYSIYQDISWQSTIVTPV